MPRTVSHLAATLALLLASAAASPVWAACAVEGQGEVNVISNSFPSLEHIAKAMMACNGNGLKVTTKLSTEHEEETKQAFQSGNSPFDVAQVSNGSFVPLYTEGLLQPMTDLVEKYRDKYDIEDRMLIKYDGEVYAIAFQTNMQYLWYRKDLFEANGIAVPKTYEEVLAAAAKLKGAEGIDYPLAGPFKAGWNVATEFTNLYRSMGGEFFQPGTAKAAFDNDKAVATLELMKAMLADMSPNSLGLATGDVTSAFQQGTVAMANMWASRASAVDDASVSRVVGKVGFAPTPATAAGGKPASNIWWDGFVMPKRNAGDRDLAFQVLMEGLDEETVASGNDLANWLRSSFKQTPYSGTLEEATKMGVPVWPSEPYFDLAHGAIGNNIPDFLSGKETAKKSLEDATAEYVEAARSAGFQP